MNGLSWAILQGASVASSMPPAVPSSISSPTCRRRPRLWPRRYRRGQPVDVDSQIEMIRQSCCDAPGSMLARRQRISGRDACATGEAANMSRPARNLPRHKAKLAHRAALALCLPVLARRGSQEASASTMKHHGNLRASGQWNAYGEVMDRRYRFCSAPQIATHASNESGD